MNKAESKGRRFLIGIIAAAVMVLAGLGACDAPPGLNGTGEVDASGLVTVRIGLPAASGGNGRSVSDDLVLVYADYYEAVFKVHGSIPGEYYFASAEAGKEYLSITVKPGVAYDILLLAGAKSGRVLLSTGFVNTDESGYDEEGEGFTVKAGQVNIIKPAMTRTNLTPDDGGDITFSGTDSESVLISSFAFSRDPSNSIATVTVPTDSDAKTLTVHLAKDKLQDLIRSGGDAPFNANKAQFVSLYRQESGVITTQIVNGVDKTAMYDYTFDSLPVPGTNVDARLLLELRCYAFGDSASRSSQWNIRNGFDYTLDNKGSGGSIMIRFGEGSSFDEDVPIDFTP